MRAALHVIKATRAWFPSPKGEELESIDRMFSNIADAARSIIDRLQSDQATARSFAAPRFCSRRRSWAKANELGRQDLSPASQGILCPT
jgi:hypothetical protein